MNTTKIGNEFEDKVYQYLSSLLETDEMPGASKSHSKIFKHKKYKAAATDRTFDFDITIENYNPQMKADDWSSIIVIECKKYSNKVDIADLDEFSGKLSRFSQTGVKGIMVTTKGFSKTEIEQAKKDHIGLVVMSENHNEWIVARNPYNKQEHSMSILCGINKVGLIPIAFSDSRFLNLVDLLQNFGAVICEKNIMNVPFLKNENLLEMATELYSSWNVGKDDIAGEILAKAYPNIKIRYSELPERMLGVLSVKEGVITLSDELVYDVHRQHFTLAHELGHLYLHGEILEKHIQSYREYEETAVAMLSDEVIKRLEVQANCFASYLLMPQKRFYFCVAQLFKEKSITTGRLYLDNQPCNISDVRYILGKLSEEFNVSKEAAKMRLINEGLLTIHNSAPRRIENIFTGW